MARLTLSVPQDKFRAEALSDFVGWGGVRRMPLLPAFVVWPRTRHDLRDTASFLLLMEATSTFRRSWSFLIYYIQTFAHRIPSCFALCGHLSPGVTIIFSLLSSVPYCPMTHSSISLMFFSIAARSSLYLSHSLLVRILLYCLAGRAPLLLFSILLQTTSTPISSFCQIPVVHINYRFRCFRLVLWAVEYSLLLLLLFTPTYFYVFLLVHVTSYL